MPTTDFLPDAFNIIGTKPAPARAWLAAHGHISPLCSILEASRKARQLFASGVITQEMMESLNRQTEAFNA